MSLAMPPITGTPPAARTATARSTAAATASNGMTRNGGRADDEMPALEQAAARPRTLARAPGRADRRRPPRPGRSGHRRSSCSISSTRPAICAAISTAGRACSAALPSAGRAGARARCRNSTRPASSPAISPNAWRLQLRDRNRLDPAMQLLLDNLPLLAARNAAGADAASAGSTPRISPRWSPRSNRSTRGPGTPSTRRWPQPVIPDILMRPQPQGGWLVELNPDTLPRVLVNNRYYARVTRGARSKAEREYLTDRLQAANWLVKSLHQRATTILKVATEIVRQQDGFLPPRRAGAAAADPARHRRRDRHAREHGQPGHHQQVHGDAARPVRAEVFLHLVDRRLARRRSRIRPRRCASASAA